MAGIFLVVLGAVLIVFTAVAPIVVEVSKSRKQRQIAKLRKEISEKFDLIAKIIEVRRSEQMSVVEKLYSFSSANIDVENYWKEIRVYRSKLDYHEREYNALKKKWSDSVIDSVGSLENVRNLLRFTDEWLVDTQVPGFEIMQRFQTAFAN